MNAIGYLIGKISDSHIITLKKIYINYMIMVYVISILVYFDTIEQLFDNIIHILDDFKRVFI